MFIFVAKYHKYLNIKSFISICNTIFNFQKFFIRCNYLDRNDNYTVYFWKYKLKQCEVYFNFRELGSFYGNEEQHSRDRRRMHSWCFVIAMTWIAVCAWIEMIYIRVSMYNGGCTSMSERRHAMHAPMKINRRRCGVN